MTTTEAQYSAPLQLFDALRERHRWRRHDGFSISDAEIKQIAAWLADRQSVNRWQAATLLVAFPVPGLLPLLRANLDHHSPLVRMHSLRAVAAAEGENAWSLYRTRLRDESSLVRLRALSLVGRYTDQKNGRRLVHPLYHLLADPDRRVRWLALQLYKQYATRVERIETCERLLGHFDQAIRWNAEYELFLAKSRLPYLNKRSIGQWKVVLLQMMLVLVGYLIFRYCTGPR